MSLFKRHHLLVDSDADDKDRVIAGVSYPVRYLGATEITTNKGKGCTDEAVARIYSQYSNKNYFKCLKTMEFFVSANCVSLSDPSLRPTVLVFRYPTVNVTFCNTDIAHSKAFVFVVKDVPSQQCKAHVVQCDSAAVAHELFAYMSEAFRVRFSLYQAKRLDKAGWTTGMENVNGHHVDELVSELPVIEVAENGSFVTEHSTDANNNNSFGEFVCAVTPAQENGWPEFANLDNEENGLRLANGDVKERFSGGVYQSANNNNENRIHNEAGFLLAKMLREANRGRIQSVPFVTDVRNGQLGLSAKDLCHAVTSRATEEETTDDFSMFARERSSSLVPKIAL